MTANKHWTMCDALKARNDLLSTRAAEKIEAQASELRGLHKSLASVQADVASAEMAVRSLHVELERARREIAALKSIGSGGPS